MTRKRRVALFVSALWLVSVYALSIPYRDAHQAIVSLGILPLLVVWGLWWVVREGDKLAVDSAPSVPATNKASPLKSLLGSFKNLSSSKFASVLVLFVSFVLVAFVNDKLGIPRPYFGAPNHLDRSRRAQSRTESALENGTLSKEMGFDKLSPIEFARSLNTRDEHFQTGARLAFENSRNSSTPNAAVRVTEIASHDLGESVRIEWSYSSVPNTGAQSKRNVVSGKLRRYFLKDGVIEVDGTCRNEISKSCSNLAALLAESEPRIVQSHPRVEGILPKPTRVSCSAPATPDVDGVICQYPTAVTLSLFRFSTAQFYATLNSKETRTQARAMLRSEGLR